MSYLLLSVALSKGYCQRGEFGGGVLEREWHRKRRGGLGAFGWGFTGTSASF